MLKCTETPPHASRSANSAFGNVDMLVALALCLPIVRHMQISDRLADCPRLSPTLVIVGYALLLGNPPIPCCVSEGGPARCKRTDNENNDAELFDKIYVGNVTMEIS